MGAPRTGSLGLGWGEQGKCFIKDAAIRVAKDREVWAMEEASRQYKQQVRRSRAGLFVGQQEHFSRGTIKVSLSILRFQQAT